jgi:hypothetical protein
MARAAKIKNRRCDITLGSQIAKDHEPATEAHCDNALYRPDEVLLRLEVHSAYWPPEGNLASVAWLQTRRWPAK